MSKLNDSTLKILKKYRLDTDMSVFGNENKLYDVVKVMDDMVGNQVSKYIGAVDVLNSLSTTVTTGYIAKENSVFAEYSANNIIQFTRDIYIYHPLTMKKIKIFKPSDNIFPIGYLFSDIGEIVCYVNLDIERKKFFCSSDEEGINNLTGTLVPKKEVSFLPYICFANTSINNSIGSFGLTVLIDGTSASNMTVNKTSTLAITLPEEIVTLGSKIYCNSPNISSYISFPKITKQVDIIEV